MAGIEKVLDLEFSATGPASLVAERSFVYGTLAACLQYPDEILIESINSGTLLKGLKSIFDFEKDLALTKDEAAGLSAKITFETLKSEYCQLFEVTTPQGAICNMFAGLHYGDRMQVMEEHIRFYNFFDLHMPETIEELPDHLSTELEFLRFLSTQEAYAIENDQPVLSLQKAQRDFISRHVLHWIDSLEESVEDYAQEPFYLSLIKLTKAVLTSEFTRVNETQDASTIPSLNLD